MDGRRVVVYEITGGSVPFRAAGSFETPTQFMCMYEQNLYTLEPGKVQVRNFQVTFFFFFIGKLQSGVWPY